MLNKTVRFLKEYGMPEMHIKQIVKSGKVKTTNGIYTIKDSKLYLNGVFKADIK